MGVAGDLGDFDLGGILQLLGGNRATGRLRVVAGGDDVSIYLERGQVAGVSSSRLPLRLGRMLRQSGLVTEQQLHEALRQQQTEGKKRPLGEVLVSRGWVTAAQLAACAHEQCVVALAKVLTVADGAFTYSAGVRPPVGIATPLNAETALLEALRRVDELGWLRSLLPPRDAPLTLTGGVEPRDSTIGEIETRVLIALRAGVGSWGELADLLPVDETALLRALIKLHDLNLIFCEGWRRPDAVPANAGLEPAGVGVASAGPLPTPFAAAR